MKVENNYLILIILLSNLGALSGTLHDTKWYERAVHVS